MSGIRLVIAALEWVKVLRSWKGSGSAGRPGLSGKLGSSSEDPPEPGSAGKSDAGAKLGPDTKPGTGTTPGLSGKLGSSSEDPPEPGFFRKPGLGFFLCFERTSNVVPLAKPGSAGGASSASALSLTFFSRFWRNSDIEEAPLLRACNQRLPGLCDPPER